MKQFESKPRCDRALATRSITGFLCVLLFSLARGDAQILPLPPRGVDAPAGTAFASDIARLPLPKRESQIASAVTIQ